ncbi:hypothetical protein MHU86_25002 [Fragilaria crotonensis]|nr:hypothetical protein MHU86_25002 [Fragilaria crotonensis]
MASLASSGGRAPSSGDKLSEHSTSTWIPTPPLESQSKLTIVQVTDVYTLEHFASLKTLLRDARQRSAPSSVVSVLTGDFLAPYLLSSVDRGAGMMNALAKTPIDYLTWGNHEADINHRTVCKHVKNFPGTFINTNMQDHEAMEYQKPFEILKVTSPDGSQTRTVGLIAVLSDDPALYKHFQEPGAFGGANIRDPWETLREYKDLLEKPPYSCDLVIPLQHMYVPDDHKTCRMFDFPVILSGHDHHRVDETIEGTRLLKPGLDAIYATVLEICWDDASSKNPKISARFVKTSDWEPDAILNEENTKAYDALLPLRNTELARVPSSFEPFLLSMLAERRVSGGVTPIVTHVSGKPLDLEKLYRVATKVSDLTNGQSPTLTEYYKAHPDALPPKGNYVNIYAELMSYFARNLWRKIWEAVQPSPTEDCDDTCMSEERLELLDRDHDGVIGIPEIHAALGDKLGLSVDANEMSLGDIRALFCRCE